MPHGKTLSENEKKLIVKLRKNNQSYRQIGRKLKRSHTVIGNFLRNPSNYAQKKRPGRKTIVSERDKRKIFRLSSNQSISAAKIVDQLSRKMSRTTINRVRRDASHLIYKKFKIFPPLTEQHKAK